MIACSGGLHDNSCKHFAVIVENTEDGVTHSEHFRLSNVGTGTVIKNLLLAVNQKEPGTRLTLYHDCAKKGTVHLSSTLRQMFDRMKNPRLEVVSVTTGNQLRLDTILQAPNIWTTWLAAWKACTSARSIAWGVGSPVFRQGHRRFDMNERSGCGLGKDRIASR